MVVSNHQLKCWKAGYHAFRHSCHWFGSDLKVCKIKWNEIKIKHNIIKNAIHDMGSCFISSAVLASVKTSKFIGLQTILGNLVLINTFIALFVLLLPWYVFTVWGIWIWRLIQTSPYVVYKKNMNEPYMLIAIERSECV